MNNVRKQQGMALLSWLIVIAILLFLMTITSRLFPMYRDYYSASYIVENMRPELQQNKLTKQQVMSLLKKRFKVSGIDKNIDNTIQLYRGQTGAHITKIVLDYERRTHLIGQLDVIGHFHKEVNIDIE